jgi:curved DNA-binding protein CbpA
VTDKKKTLYELLEVSRNASLTEIQAAYRRLSLNLVSGKSGLSPEDTSSRLKEIDLAFHTLSAEGSREAYDSQLAAFKVPATVAMGLQVDAKSLKIAAAIEDSYKMAAVIESGHELPLKVISSAVSGTASALKKILRAFIFFIVVGMVLQTVLAVSSSRKMEHEATKADEKLYIQEYYKKYGVRIGSKAEGVLLEAENSRKENEQRAAELEEKRKKDEYDRFVEESRRKGEQISAELRRNEERARNEEEQKKRQYERQFEQERLEQEEVERNRIEEERARLQQASAPTDNAN